VASDEVNSRRAGQKIAVIDGKGNVQKLTRQKATMKTVKNLSECFIEKLLNLLQSMMN